MTKRKGNIYSTAQKGDLFSVGCLVPLSQMFGFSSELRGYTQGQGEFTMEYKTHLAVSPEDVKKIINDIKLRKKKTN